MIVYIRLILPVLLCPRTLMPSFENSPVPHTTVPCPAPKHTHASWANVWASRGTRSGAPLPINTKPPSKAKSKWGGGEPETKGYILISLAFFWGTKQQRIRFFKIRYTGLSFCWGIWCPCENRPWEAAQCKDNRWIPSLGRVPAPPASPALPQLSQLVFSLRGNKQTKRV